MIKKGCLLLLCGIISIASVSAGQRKKVDSAWLQKTYADKHRVYISLGGGFYPPDMKYINIKDAREAFPGVNYNGSVKFFIGRDIALSVACTYDNKAYTTHKRSETIVPTTLSTTATRDYKYTTLAAAVECTMIYDRIYRTNRVLYTTLSLGIGHSTSTAVTGRYEEDYPNLLLNPGAPIIRYDVYTEKSDTTRIRSHYSIVGIRGGKKVCWYAELGYGFKGIVNAGLSLRL